MTLQRCETSYGAARGECAVWLNGDTLCSRTDGHYPGTPHRGYNPYGTGQWIDYVEIDGRAVEVARGGPTSATRVDTGEGAGG